MSKTAGKRTLSLFPLSPLILVTVAAFALRLAVLWWRKGNDPFFLQPINDSAMYLAWAHALMADTPFGIPGAPFHLAPFYPHFLSWVLPLGNGSLWPVMIIQAVMGSLTVLGTGLLAGRLAGDRAAWLAGLLIALCAPLIWYEGWLMPTSLNLFLLVLGMNLLVVISEPRRWYGVLPVLSGLVLGLAAVNRPQQLLVVAGACVWLFFIIWKNTFKGSWIKRWQPLILLVFGALVAIAPVTIHNLKASGEPVLITANAGLNFYSGNYSKADGRFGLPAGFSPYIQEQQRVARDLAWKQSGDELNWQGVSRHWFNKAWTDIKKDPGHYIKLSLNKLRLSLTWREMENNFLAGWVHNHLGPGRVLFPSLSFLWILAIPALVRSIRERSTVHGPLWITLGATLITCILFWVSARNRLPLAIPLAIFSAMSLANPKIWLKPISLAATAVVAVLVIWPTGEPQEGAEFYVDLGRIHAQSGDHLAARKDFRLALEIEPETPMAINGLALTYMEEGNKSKAVAILKDLLRRYPDFEYARRNLNAIMRSGPSKPAK